VIGVVICSWSRVMWRGVWSTMVGIRPHATIVSRSSSTAGARVLTMDTLNPNVRAMEYAVRGPVVIRAAAIEKELQKVRRRLLTELQQSSRLWEFVVN